MANLIPDDIDFSEYMQETDAAHKVIPASEYAQEVEAYFHDDEENTDPLLPWKKAGEKIAFRPGEVTLWAGMNGHGKSLVLGQVVNGFSDHGNRTVIASMEMKPRQTLVRMCRQASGVRVPSRSFIQSWHKLTDGSLWLYDQQGAVRPEKILAVLRYSADKIQAHHFVIDSFMKCGVVEDDWNAQKRFIDGLCTIGRDTGMHIHLVAHSKKQADELKPIGKMDIKGSGSITDQVDNVCTVFRNKRKEVEGRDHKIKIKTMASDADCCLIIDKQRNGEWEGVIPLWFNEESLSFEDHTTAGF